LDAIVLHQIVPAMRAQFKMPQSNCADSVCTIKLKHDFGHYYQIEVGENGSTF